MFLGFFYYQDHVYEHKSTQINTMKSQIFCLYGVEVAGHKNRHLPNNHPKIISLVRNHGYWIMDVHGLKALDKILKTTDKKS